MKIMVRFAGYFRTLAERSALELELKEQATVAEALAELDQALDGRCSHVFYPNGAQNSTPNFFIVVETEIVDRETILQEGNTMAIVPPMAGG
ncbi:MAG: MoaD/ThiS family protein [Chloroflexi bacterium]|nr:MoaD/ThiS family protein [Chloroflexota bacterium]